jgi:hypothetical protein
MTNDVDKRAAKLVEVEKEREAEQEARRREQAEASRLTDARKRIKQHDRDLAQERARKEAAAEAADLARELGERAVDLQRGAEALRGRIENYADLRARLEDAKRRSGRGGGGSYSTSIKPVLGGWFRSVFGGHDSLVEVQSEMAGRVLAVGNGPRTLAVRDPFASTRTNPDVGEAS